MEAKEITHKRIKRILEEFIGGRRERITLNHVIGQMRSAIRHEILSIEECGKIIGEVETGIKEGKIFPTVPRDEKLRKLNES
jgi:hypothetical protein